MSKKSIRNSLFSIHLIEDEDGHITVIAESIGNGINSFNIGHHLLLHLSEIEMQEPRLMTVQMPLYSEHRH